MLLKPLGKIDLEHRAFLFRGNSTGSAVVTGMDDSRLTIIRRDFVTTESVRLSSAIGSISLHPSKDVLAWVDAKSGLLRVQTLQAQQVTKIAPPLLLPGAPDWIRPRFEGCYFDESGDFLWLIGWLGDQEVEVQLLRADNWSIVGKHKVEARHFGSSSSFHETGRPGLVSLWLAAGDICQDVYWLNRSDRGFSCHVVPELVDTPPPAFSPDGSHFLTVDNDFNMRCYEFSTMREIGSGLQSPVEDDPFVESYCYLNSGYALAGTNEQRIFLVNTTEMKVEDEVAVEGHESRPVGEYYPTLADNPGLCTELGWFTRIGDTVVFVYRRDGGHDLNAWKDSLLWYRVTSPTARSTDKSG